MWTGFVFNYIYVYFFKTLFTSSFLVDVSQNLPEMNKQLTIDDKSAITWTHIG